MNLQSAAAALGGEVSGNQVLAPGPGHSPDDRSLSVKFDPTAPDGILVHSFSGDDWQACKDHAKRRLGIQDEWKRAANGSAFDRMQESASKARAADASREADAAAAAEQDGPTTVVARYVYQNAAGSPHAMAVRTSSKKEPKGYFQQRWSGSGWERRGAKPTKPYRLPELIAAVHDTVFVVEGEKDADNLAKHGFIATTNIGGAGNWKAELNEHFAGKAVYILPDNDDAGAKHALAVARHLHGVAGSVRIVKLLGLPPKGDVSDWLETGGDHSKLVGICKAAPAFEPGPESGNPDEPGNPEPGNPEPDAPVSAPAIAWLDMSSWDTDPVPERKWAILDRVPLLQAGLFSGEGGTGKSILELHKNVAHVTATSWLGTMPEQGPAIYVGAEDDKDEIHIRLAAIASHCGVSFKELVAGGLHVLPLLGQDATLCAASGKSGKIETTALYKQLYEAAGDIKPINISIDTLSRAFAGNEIDRVQVYAFAMHMQALAMVAGGSVTVLSHPSLAGISTGTGLSGSTGWHGAFRFRQYLTGVKPDAGEQPENDLRQLEFKKNQYGPIGETIVLSYQQGLFLPVPGMSNLTKAAKEAKACEIFLAMLARFDREGRNVSDRSGTTYAPAVFAAEEEAKKAGIRNSNLKAAMRQLFVAGKIRVESYGPQSRLRSKLVAVA